MEGAPRGPPDPPSAVPGEAEAGLAASGAREEESGGDGMPGVWIPNTSHFPGGLLNRAGRVEVEEGVAGLCGEGARAGQCQVQACAWPGLTARRHPKEQLQG